MAESGEAGGDEGEHDVGEDDFDRKRTMRKLFAIGEDDIGEDGDGREAFFDFDEDDVADRDRFADFERFLCELFRDFRDECGCGDKCRWPRTDDDDEEASYDRLGGCSTIVNIDVVA